MAHRMRAKAAEGEVLFAENNIAVEAMEKVVGPNYTVTMNERTGNVMIEERREGTRKELERAVKLLQDATALAGRLQLVGYIKNSPDTAMLVFGTGRYCRVYLIYECSMHMENNQIFNEICLN